MLGRCDEHVAAPHAPWTELLRQLVTNVGEDVIVEHVARHGGEIGRLVPDLVRRVPDVPPPTATDPDTERLLLFDAVVDILQPRPRSRSRSSCCSTTRTGPTRAACTSSATS